MSQFQFISLSNLYFDMFVTLEFVSKLSLNVYCLHIDCFCIRKFYLRKKKRFVSILKVILYDYLLCLFFSCVLFLLYALQEEHMCIHVIYDRHFCLLFLVYFMCAFQYLHYKLLKTNILYICNVYLQLNKISHT